MQRLVKLGLSLVSSVLAVVCVRSLLGHHQHSLATYHTLLRGYSQHLVQTLRGGPADDNIVTTAGTRSNGSSVASRCQWRSSYPAFLST